MYDEDVDSTLYREWKDAKECDKEYQSLKKAINDIRDVILNVDAPQAPGYKLKLIEKIISDHKSATFKLLITDDWLRQQISTDDDEYVFACNPKDYLKDYNDMEFRALCPVCEDPAPSVTRFDDGSELFECRVCGQSWDDE